MPDDPTIQELESAQLSLTDSILAYDAQLDYLTEQTAAVELSQAKAEAALVGINEQIAAYFPAPTVGLAMVPYDGYFTWQMDPVDKATVLNLNWGPYPAFIKSYKPICPHFRYLVPAPNEENQNARARGGDGKNFGPYSGEYEGDPASGGLDAPAIASATKTGARQVTVTVVDGGFGSYQIWRSDKAGGPYSETPGTFDGLTKVVDDIDLSVPNYFVATAYNEDTSSPISEEVRVFS